MDEQDLRLEGEPTPETMADQGEAAARGLDQPEDEVAATRLPRPSAPGPGPWGTLLVLIGGAVAVWLVAAPRRRPRAPRRQQTEHPMAGHEFTRTHYDAGAEHTLESGAARLTDPDRGSPARSQTLGGTSG